MEKNKVIVKIRNKEYIVMSADPQEYILSVANELDSRINEIASENATLNPERLIILASLNLCDEYMKLIETNKTLQKQMKNYSVNDSGQLMISDIAMKEELELAKEQIKLLETKLSDDVVVKKEFDELKSRVNTAEAEKQQIKMLYEKEIETLKAEFAKKENEWLEMIDKM